MLTSTCLAIAIGAADPLPAREVYFSWRRKAIVAEMANGERRTVYLGPADATFDGCVLKVEPGDVIHRDSFQRYDRKN